MLKNLILFVIAAWLLAMLLIADAAYGQERGRIYDNAGQYRGRIEPDYSGTRSRVLDEQGRRVGTVDRAAPREPRSFGPSPDIRGNFWKDQRR